MYKQQFVISKKECANLTAFKSVELFLDFKLYYHEGLQLNRVVNGTCELFILGDLFDAKLPKNSNSEIVSSMSDIHTFDDFSKRISLYAGRFIALYINRESSEFFVLNDACSQSQLFYDTSFENLGTTVAILSNFTAVKPHSNSAATDYYKSDDFKKLKLFVSDTTHVENMSRLLPNHAVDMIAKKCFRFFPIKKLERKSVEEVAKLAAELLRGYIMSMSNRYHLYVPITAGYDSRLLFLASLDIPCTYFVTRFKGMPDDHEDLVFAKKIAAMYDKELKIIDDLVYPPEDFEKSYADSLDFPSFTTPDSVGKNVIVNGNISEIARNHFHHLIAINGGDFNFLHQYEKHPFVTKELQNWLDKSKNKILKNGYHLLDFFLWEQFMGILHAKSKTETNQLGVTVFTPYNSRFLLESMLSTQRKYRFRDHNKLYDAIIKCYTDKEAMLQLPVNPNPIQDRHFVLHKLGLFKMYTNLRTKLRV